RLNAYPTGASPTGGPMIHSVTLSGSGCSPDPYFFTNGCTVTVKAYVDFAAGAIYQDSGPSKKNAFITINGADASHGSDAGGDYWTAPFTIGAGDGQQLFKVDWEQRYGSTGGTVCGDGPAKNPIPRQGT